MRIKSYKAEITWEDGKKEIFPDPPEIKEWVDEIEKERQEELKLDNEGDK